jgi:hypothetical protein
MWPAGIIEIVNVARTIWKVEDPWRKVLASYPPSPFSFVFPQFPVLQLSRESKWTGTEGRQVCISNLRRTRRYRRTVSARNGRFNSPKLHINHFRGSRVWLAVPKIRPNQHSNSGPKARSVQLQWLIYPAHHVSKPRRILRPFNLRPIDCPETSVNRCITTQKRAYLKEALYHTLWRTAFERHCVPVAKTDCAPSDSSKISPLSDQALSAPVHLPVRLEDRQHLRHHDRTCCSTQNVQ